MRSVQLGLNTCSDLGAGVTADLMGGSPHGLGEADEPQQ